MDSFLPSRRLAIGANYWASHAGIAMWRDWKPEIVDRDFALLSANGLQVLRVFPLWPDFQPITLLRTERGRPVEFRWGELPLPDDAPHGVSAEMLSRFEVLADCAAKHGLDLIVGLITGWMSGRLFVPPGLEGMNPITDPASIIWQIRLARTFVGRFKAHPAIKAWDLGNECNVMGQATAEQSWLWTSTIADTIRAADPGRPIVSGMHSLEANPAEPWSIRQQGELTDFLTTHPYPIFTPHCHREPLNTMRPILHGTAETRLYADLGSKPAFVEEYGTIGPMILGNDEAAGFVRASLASFWAHDCRAGLWWCAHDQLALDYAPYDWVAVERELGLLTLDGAPKPCLREMKAFRERLEALPFRELPRRNIDAVCILTPGQDNWAVAFSAFVLAAQAGFDLQFHYADRALPESSCYLVPSLSGLMAVSRRREEELWAKVRAGATAYVSLGDGLLGRFAEFTGATVSTRSERKGPAAISFPAGPAFSIAAKLQYNLRLQTAEPLAVDEAGFPVFCKNKVGAGEVFLLTVPLEASVAVEPQAFNGADQPAFLEVYRTIAGRVLSKRLLRKTNPNLGITEHPMPDGTHVAILINYSPEPLEDHLALCAGHVLAGADAAPNRQYPIHLPPHGFDLWTIQNL